MKNCFLFFSLILLISACSDEADTPTETNASFQEIQLYTLPSEEIINQQFAFNINSPTDAFNNKNEILNTINNTIRCTLSPKQNICSNLNLPKFILMEDESLQRPTEMQYKITKIKPLSGGLLHIYTQSQCNNNWFGLCRGNIIYVMQNKDNAWYVSDIFALADTK